MKDQIIEIARIDESEAKVILDGVFLISYEQKSDFYAEFCALVDKYKI